MGAYAKKAFLVTALASLTATAAAAPLVGTYERLATNKQESGKLVVSEVKSNQATVDLEVLFNPYPRDGRFSYRINNEFIRNGVLQSEALALNGNVGLFNAPKEDDTPCSLVFVFEGNYVKVTQFGECSWFGVGVTATGRYVRRSSKGTAK